MLKIKLSRQGKKHQPHYRIIVAEDRSKRDGIVADLLGYYRPTSQDKTISLDLPRYQSWLKKGAQPTSTVKNLVERVKKS